MQATHIHAPAVPDASPSFLSNLWQSFRWAMAVSHRCEAWSATGRPLDGDAIRQVLADVERQNEGRP